MPSSPRPCLPHLIQLRPRYGWCTTLRSGQSGSVTPFSSWCSLVDVSLSRLSPPRLPVQANNRNHATVLARPASPRLLAAAPHRSVSHELGPRTVNASVSVDHLNALSDEIPRGLGSNSRLRAGCWS